MASRLHAVAQRGVETAAPTISSSRPTVCLITCASPPCASWILACGLECPDSRHPAPQILAHGGERHSPIHLHPILGSFLALTPSASCIPPCTPLQSCHRPSTLACTFDRIKRPALVRCKPSNAYRRPPAILTMCESSMSSLLCAALGSVHLSPFACRRLFWSRLAAPHHHCLRTPAVVPLDCALSRSGSRSVMRSTTRVEIRVPVPFPQVRRGSSRAPGQLGQRQRVRPGDRRDHPHACMRGVSRTSTAHGRPVRRR